MREIRTEIEINAPADKVWEILMDINKWKDWNPIVNGASGNAEQGAQLSIIMKDADGNDANEYKPVITDMNKPTFFKWRATMMASFMFTNYKIFELKESGSVTKLVHIEAFKGLMASMFWKSMEASVPSMLKAMNEALKELAEE